MLFCEKCGISVRGRPNVCPLCQGSLSGTPEGPELYPPLREHSGNLSFAIRLAAFVTVVGVFLCAALSYAESGRLIGWWLIVAAGAVSFWLPLGLALRLRGNVTKCIVFTALLCCLLAFFWDLGYGYRGWSLDWVLPITCCVSLLTMAVIARILSLHIEQYIYYLIIDIFMGAVQLILLLCGAIRMIFPSVICVASCIIFLAALLLFEGKALRAELIRRTHL